MVMMRLRCVNENLTRDQLDWTLVVECPRFCLIYWDIHMNQMNIFGGGGVGVGEKEVLLCNEIRILSCCSLFIRN